MSRIFAPAPRKGTTILVMGTETTGVENAEIAERLEAFAALLDLSEASSFSVRAYRRAAELVRATPAPVAELVRSGRVRELAGIGPGIERRLRELVETGEIAELRELEARALPGARRARPADRDRAGADGGDRPRRSTFARSRSCAQPPRPAASGRCAGSARRRRRGSWLRSATRDRVGLAAG